MTVHWNLEADRARGAESAESAESPCHLCKAARKIRKAQSKGVAWVRPPIHRTPMPQHGVSFCEVESGPLNPKLPKSLNLKPLSI